MPKLPEEKNANILEVADKGSYNRGELTIPKIPKHRIVFKHHFKLVLILLAVCVMLALVFAAGKPLINRDKQGEVQTQAPDTASVPSYTEESFKNYTEEDYKAVNPENSIWIVVDKVDLQNKVVEGREYDDVGKKHAVKFGQKAEFYWVSAPNEDGTGGGKKIPVEFGQLVNGSVIKVLSFEDPKVSVTLTVVSAERIV